MELRVFDKTVQPLGAIDELASLLWHTKYFDVGTFSLLAQITDNNSRLLVEGNLITKHDGKKEVKTADGGVWRRAAQITYVHITKKVREFLAKYTDELPDTDELDGDSTTGNVEEHRTQER